MDFGRRLDKAMMRADCRADVLAYLMCVPLSTVVMWLRSVPPPDAQTVVRLSVVLGCSPFDLDANFSSHF